MTKTILVPIDGSPLSWKALRRALVEFPDASVRVLHVIDLFEPGYGAYPDFETSYEPLMGTPEWYERAEEISEQLFQEARAIAGDADRDLQTASEIGDPKRVIVDYAAEEDIAYIILGAHGRPEEDRPVYGSIAEVIARRAPVSVMIVR